MFSNFISKILRLWDNVGKYWWGRPQMTIWCMHSERWITKATNKFSVYLILLLFDFFSGCTNVQECYVTLTLPVWLLSFTNNTNIAALHNNDRRHSLFTPHTFSTTVTPSSLSVRSPLYAVLCCSLSPLSPICCIVLFIQSTLPYML